MNKTKPVPSSFTHTSLETEAVGAGFAACLRGSACSYLGPSTRLPETWVNLIRHLGLDFISHASFLKHALFSARPAPFPGELQTNLAQLAGNSSRSVKHVTGSAVEGWEGAGVTPGRNPGCAHHLAPPPFGEQQESRGECAAFAGPLSPALPPDTERVLVLAGFWLGIT